MADSMTTDVVLPEDRPPDWANSLMRWALSLPGVQRVIGKQVALLTFTGHKTGADYNIPVSYQRTGDTVTVVTKRRRNWWRNFETPRKVELRLAGINYVGKAQIKSGNDEILAFMTEYLAKRPIDAKAYGLGKDEIAPDEISRIVPHIVVIEIEITPAG